MSKDCIVISTSLNPDSRSRVLAKKVFEELKAHANVEFVDLKDYELPVCDGEGCYAHPNVSKLTAKIEQAKAVLLAVPVYNYSCAASAKNLIELTGNAWNEKVVGFLCAAGGKSSYMSILGLANSLMLDFRCLINPRFVYADGSAFDGDEVSDQEINKRIGELAASTMKLVERVTTKV